MKVIVQGKSLEITRSLRSFVLKQAEKLQRLNIDVSKVRVYLEHVARKNSDPKRALAKFHIDFPGKRIVVKRKAVDLYDAIVDAANSVSRQARRFKEKRIKKQRTKIFH